MKLLASHLKRHTPCDDGIKWFKKTFPQGIDLCVAEKVRKWLRNKKVDADGDVIGDADWLCDVLVLIVMVRPRFGSVRVGALITKVGEELVRYLGRDPLDEYLLTEDIWEGLLDLPNDRLVKAAGEIWKAAGPAFVRKGTMKR